MTLREPILLGHVWPIALRIGGASLLLVDDTDPTLRPLWEGETILGWEGDERLRVYFCPDRASWELVRLEGNGTYTSISRVVETGAITMPELVGRWIVWLLTHDGRRGHDVLVAQDDEDAKAEAEWDKALTEKLAEEIEPRFNHALRKDGEDAPGGIW